MQDNNLIFISIKRDKFIKTFATFAGSAFLLGCEKELMGDFVENVDISDLSIADAKNWFNETYIAKYASSRIEKNGKYNRSADWNKAKKIKFDNKQEIVWVPINYSDNQIPGIVVWDENTQYRSKMSKQFVHPIMEGLIVYKEKNVNKAFLGQIAYDPIDAKSKKNTIQKSDFTGWLIKADWEDALMEGVNYKNGKMVSTFDAQSLKRGRVSDCYYTVVSYQTVSVQNCGPNCTEVTVTLTRSSQYICGGGGNSAYNNGSYFSNPSYFGGGGFGNGEGGYVPLSVQPLDTTSRTFDIRKAVCNPGSDRALMSQGVADALNATGLAAGVTGFSLDKAEALARSFGGNLSRYDGLINGVGVFGLVIDSVQLVAGVWDNGFTLEDDGLNLLQVGLGVAGLLTVGWVAVTIGAVSVGVAVYAQTLDNQPTCP